MSRRAASASFSASTYPLPSKSSGSGATTYVSSTQVVDKRGGTPNHNALAAYLTTGLVTVAAGQKVIVTSCSEFDGSVSDNSTITAQLWVDNDSDQDAAVIATLIVNQKLPFCRRFEFTDITPGDHTFALALEYTGARPSIPAGATTVLVEVVTV